MFIFLDFDGVLHPISRPNGTFSQLALFESTVRQMPGLKIVITSGWRLELPYDQLVGKFSPDVRSCIVGMTPNLQGELQHTREKEIHEWLFYQGEHPRHWIAIDDSDWLFTPGCKNLILVDSYDAFTESTSIELLKRLTPADAFNQRVHFP